MKNLQRNIRLLILLCFMMLPPACLLAAPSGGVKSETKVEKAKQKKPAKKATSPNKQPAAQSKAEKQVKDSSSKNLVPGGITSDEPVYINSDSLNLDGEKKIFFYTGHVVVKQADLTLTADQLEGRYDDNNQVQLLTARGNVTVNKGADIKASGETAVYDKALETIVLTDNPQIEQKGSWLSADTIRIFLRENRSQAEGNVRMKLDEAAAPSKIGSNLIN